MGLGFLNPWALLAMGAVVLPIVIHLFSRSRGKRVLVGGIALYRQSQLQRVLEPRIREWLLLLLRVLILGLAALLLAELARPDRPTLTGSSAYVTPDWLANATEETIADLSQDQIYVLRPEFPTLENRPAASEPAKTHSRRQPASTLGLLAQRLADVEHEGTVTVYATTAAREFPVVAPALGTDVDWQLLDVDKPVTPSADLQVSVSVLYAPERFADARQVQTALAGAARASGIALTTVLVESMTADAISTDVNNPTHRVVIALGQTVPDLPDAIDVLIEDSPPSAAAGSELILPMVPGYHFAVAPTPVASDWDRVTWRANDGRPVLVSRVGGALTRHRLLVPLMPGDNALLSSPVFPDVLLRLALGETHWHAGYQRAPVDPVSVLTRPAISQPVPMLPLTDTLLLVLVLLTLIERVLSERRVSGVQP